MRPVHLWQAARGRQCTVGAILALLVIPPAALAPVTTARAASTITVTSTADSGTGSLRQAIAGAASGDSIQFNPSLDGQTITLTSGELVIDKSLTISGPGASELTISGNHAGRIFFINPGAAGATSGPPATNPSVAIGGITIANGLAKGSNGGAADAAGGSGGAAGLGGAIFVNGGALTLTGTVITGSTAQGGTGSGGPASFFGAAGGAGIAGSGSGSSFVVGAAKLPEIKQLTGKAGRGR